MNDFEKLLNLRREEELMKYEIEIKKEESLNVQALKFDRIAPNTTRELDPTLRNYLYIDDLEQELLGLYDARKRLEKTILERIDQLSTHNERYVLKEYYIFREPLDQIATSLKIDYYDIYGLKRKAVKRYEELFN